MFHRSKPNDVLFLMPVRLADEKTPRNKVRMLYCDATGKVYSSMINKSTYELARQSAETVERSHKSYATVGLEIGPGAFVPTPVEISPEELWALEHILEHALNKGRLPDILKRYLKPSYRNIKSAAVSPTPKRHRGYWIDCRITPKTTLKSPCPYIKPSTAIRLLSSSTSYQMTAPRINFRNYWFLIVMATWR